MMKQILIFSELTDFICCTESFVEQIQSVFTLSV